MSIYSVRLTKKQNYIRQPGESDEGCGDRSLYFIYQTRSSQQWNISVSTVCIYTGGAAHESASFTYSRKNDGVKEGDGFNTHHSSRESKLYSIQLQQWLDITNRMGVVRGDARNVWRWLKPPYIAIQVWAVGGCLGCIHTEKREIV